MYVCGQGNSLEKRFPVLQRILGNQAAAENNSCKIAQIEHVMGLGRRWQQHFDGTAINLQCAADNRSDDAEDVWWKASFLKYQIVNSDSNQNEPNFFFKIGLRKRGLTSKNVVRIVLKMWVIVLSEKGLIATTWKCLTNRGVIS